MTVRALIPTTDTVTGQVQGWSAAPKPDSLVVRDDRGLINSDATREAVTRVVKKRLENDAFRAGHYVPYYIPDGDRWVYRVPEKDNGF